MRRYALILYRPSRLPLTCQRVRVAVGQVALNMGYGDRGFFHRVFRRHTGCSPTEYRRRFGAGQHVEREAAGEWTG